MKRTSFKIMLDSSELDRVAAERIKEYLLTKILEIPLETLERRQAYSALQWATGADKFRLRRLCVDLGIDPYERLSSNLDE